MSDEHFYVKVGESKSPRVTAYSCKPEKRQWSSFYWFAPDQTVPSWLSALKSVTITAPFNDSKVAQCLITLENGDEWPDKINYHIWGQL